MTPPAISILIPTKNRKDFLERAVQSVFAQTVAPEQVVIVNDGSSDGTAEFLDHLSTLHPEILVIHRAQSGGVNTARNEGIKKCTSQWIAMLDDDDEFFPDAIATMKRKILETPPQFGVVFFNSCIDTGEETYVGGYQFTDNREYCDVVYEEFILKKGLRGDCKPVMHRDLFFLHGYWFPETVNGLESYTMYLIARDNRRIRCYKDVLTHIHLEQTFEHLSFFASRKNPAPVLVLHRMQLDEHIQFYRTHRDALLKLYITMAKLAVHSRQIFVGLMILYGYVLGSLNLTKYVHRLPGSLRSPFSM